MSRIAVLLAALLLLLAPAPGRAAFHTSVIDEVMSGVNNGTVNNPNIQYVEIRELLSGQNFVCHTRLTVFKCMADGGGFQVLIDNLGGAGATQPCVPNGTAGARWIMASPDAATFLAASGITPDVTWNNGTTGNIPTACGMVCWGAPGSFLPPTDPSTWMAGVPTNYVDCVAYGPYDGAAEPFANPAATDTPGGGTFSLTRMGDTMFSNNFQLACPSPTSNPAQAEGDFGPCPPSGTTTTLTATTSTTVTTTSFPPGSGQPVAGTKLLLKANPSKPAKKALVLVAKDAGLVAGDPTQTGGSLRVSTSAGGGFDTSYPLPASRWKPIGKGKGYRFKDPAGPIKSVVVKPGKVAKAIGRGSGLGHTLAADPDPVTVLLAVGTQRDCMSFAGGKFVAGKKYLATNDPPPAACP